MLQGIYVNYNRFYIQREEEKKLQKISIYFIKLSKFVILRHQFADVISVHNRNMKHTRANEFDYTNLLAMLPVYSIITVCSNMFESCDKCKPVTVFS